MFKKLSLAIVVWSLAAGYSWAAVKVKSKFNPVSGGFDFVIKLASTSVGELLDVSTASATNGQVLKYNSSTGVWEPGTDNSTAASGATIEVEEGGSSVVNTSTVNFSAGLDVVDNSGKAQVTVDLTETSGLTADPQQIRVSTDGTQVAISTGVNFVSGAGITLSGTETGNRADITITSTLGTSVASSEIADGDHGDFTYSGAAATLDNDVVAAAEMADADHGDVSWSGGVATVDNVAAVNVAAGSLGAAVMVSSVAQAGFYSNVAVRTNLGLAIGTDVQAFDADLSDLADGSLTGSKVGDGVPAANIAAGSLDVDVIASSVAADAVGVEQLSASGSPSATTFLRGDNSWASPAGSGDAVLAATQTWTGQNTFNNMVTISTTIAGVVRIEWADGTVQVSSPVASGGGGPAYWQAALLPESAVLDASSAPAITTIQSSGTGTPRFRVADFDATTDEIVYWTFVVPSDMASGDWLLDISWYTNDTGANEDAIWAAQLSATTEGDADTMAEQAADTANTASEDCNATEANRLIQTTLTLSNLDSVAAGDVVTLRFFRDADDSVGDADNDGLSSDARLVAVRVRIPRS